MDINSKLKDYLFGKISQDEFEKLIKKKVDKAFLNDLLKKTLTSRDAVAVELTIMFGLKHQLFDESQLKVLLELLSVDWHMKHEDIVRLVEMNNYEATIQVLFETSTKKFEYLAYNNSEALARKCIKALGKIGSELAKDRLEELSNSNDRFVAEVALKELNRS